MEAILSETMDNIYRVYRISSQKILLCRFFNVIWLTLCGMLLY
jgi:hypothetical protein